MPVAKNSEATSETTLPNKVFITIFAVLMMSPTGYLNDVMCTLCSVALFQVQYRYFKPRHRQPLVTGEGENKNVDILRWALKWLFPQTLFGPYKAFNILLGNLVYILGVQRACEDLVPVLFLYRPTPIMYRYVFVPRVAKLRSTSLQIIITRSEGLKIMVSVMSSLRGGADNELSSSLRLCTASTANSH